MLLYYITDRSQFPGDASAKRRLLLDRIRMAVHAGVDFIQLREKYLSMGELESLAREAAQIVNENSRPSDGSRLLINSRTDVATVTGAHGVHLPSNDISPAEVRHIWNLKIADLPTISVACHSVAEVRRASENGADFAVFGPVFGKITPTEQIAAKGLEHLRAACKVRVPVVALGGVTLDNAKSCLDSGTAGIAGIRLFQENSITEVVRQLRNFSA